MANKLARYVFQCEENAEIVSEYKAVGWSQEGDCKFLGHNENYVGSMDLSALESQTMYKTELNKLLRDCIGSQLTVTLSLSSALFSYLEDKLHKGTQIFHFFGDSSCGKTTSLILAASMWGNPEAGKGILGTWNATDNAMLSSLNNNFGVSLCFDEAGTIGNRDFSNLIYCISQGINRARLTKDCEQQVVKSWCTTVLSSGENSLLDASNQNSALRARVSEFLDFPLTTGAIHS